MHHWCLLYRDFTVLKSVLIDLCAHNFVHMKTSFHGRCVHACHCARNLSSPAYLYTSLRSKSVTEPTQRESSRYCITF